MASDLQAALETAQPRKSFVPRALLTLVVLFLSSVSVWGWAYSGHKWPGTVIPYWVNPANNDVSPAAALAALQWAAEQWSSQTDADIQFVYQGKITTGASRNGKNEFVFVQESRPYIGQMLRYWTGSTLTETDLLLFDASWKFFAGYNGCSGGYYIEEIAIHELGHALGLDHSSVSGATMKAGANKCATWKGSLSVDDVQAVESVYGTVDMPPDPDPEPGLLTASIEFYIWNAAIGKYQVKFLWSGSTALSMDIFKDGVLWRSAINDGAQKFTIGNAGPHTFVICEAGTVVCSASFVGSAGSP